MAKIAYIGSFGRQYNTEVHFARDARSLGHQVTEFEERAVADDIATMGGAATAADIELAGYDLVLYTKSTGLPAAATAWWREIERAGARTASFHLDLYSGLPRGEEMGADPFWTVGDVFTADGDPSTTEQLAARGIRHHWLPAACVSDECVLIEKYSLDVARIVFVGSSRSYHPSWPWRLELLGALRRRYGHRFASYGPQDSGLVEGLALNALYQRPGRIVIGDTLAMPNHRNYWSNRYYETLGRGGFLIAPHVPGIDAHFTDGEHLRFYEIGDLPYLFDLIDYFLEHPDQTRVLAHAGMANVREHHTYRHRVGQMLDTLGLS